MIIMITREKFIQLDHCFRSAHAFAVEPGPIEAANTSLPGREHRAGIVDPKRASLRPFGGGDPVDPISARDRRDVRPQRPRLQLEAKVVIGFVRSNPEPVILAVPFAGDRAIASANFYGVDAALLLES